MNEISFFVPGVPRPAGSKKAFHHSATGKIMVVDACEASRDWKTTVSQFALQAMKGQPPADGALSLTLEFYMPRPRCHYRPNGRVKENAPEWHLNAPDATKLTRAVEDALNGIAWRDDRQIAKQAILKVYAEGPGVQITVEAI